MDTQSVILFCLIAVIVTILINSVLLVYKTLTKKNDADENRYLALNRFVTSARNPYKKENSEIEELSNLVKNLKKDQKSEG